MSDIGISIANIPYLYIGRVRFNTTDSPVSGTVTLGNVISSGTSSHRTLICQTSATDAYICYDDNTNWQRLALGDKASGFNFQMKRLGNNSTMSFYLPNRDLWLLYRSYQPNLLKISQTGAVEVGFGKNESITISASNNTVTIKNTIGWAVNYICFIGGN